MKLPAVKLDIIGQDGETVIKKSIASTSMSPSTSLTINHIPDPEYKRFISVNKMINGDSYIDTSLDFDLEDENKFNKLNGGVEFYNGVIQKLNNKGHNNNYKNLIDTFNTVIYVDGISGSDTNGDGSKNNPYKTYDKGYASTPDGQCLVLSNIECKKTIPYTSSEINGIFNFSKNITIVADSENPTSVILRADVSGSTDVRCAFRVTNIAYSVKLYGICLILENTASNVTYSSCLFRYRDSWSTLPSCYNCIIINKHGHGFEYLSSGGSSGAIFENCFITGETHELSNYGADSNITINNCEFFNVATNISGTKTYCRFVSGAAPGGTISYLQQNNPHTACTNTGDPSVTNPDGTRSHIGIAGSTYAHPFPNYTSGNFVITTTDLNKIITTQMSSISQINIIENDNDVGIIKYALSFDNRNTWKIISNNSLINIPTQDLSNLHNEGMLSSDISANISTISTEALNGGSIDFAISISSTDLYKSPYVDQIEIHYTAIGYYKNVDGDEFDQNFKLKLYPDYTTLENIGNDTYSLKFTVEI